MHCAGCRVFGRVCVCVVCVGLLSGGRSGGGKSRCQEGIEAQGVESWPARAHTGLALSPPFVKMV